MFERIYSTKRMIQECDIVVRKISGATSTRFVNDLSGRLTNVLAETNTLNNTIGIKNYYVYGSGLISQGSAASNTRNYFITDGLGNVRLLTDSSGALLKKYTYDPYGVYTSSADPTSSLYRFQGQQLDTDTNLFYMRARYYDQTIGRFISKDPVEGYLVNPQTQNSYSYAINDPINKSDPSGLEYVNLGVSAGLFGGGISCGVMINDKGAYPYVSAGVATPGPGVSLTFSPADPEPGFSLNLAAQSGTPRTLFLAGQYSYDLDRKNTNYEIGFGAPIGASLMLQQTFDKME